MRRLHVTINTLSVTMENEGIRTMLVGLVPALVRASGDHVFQLICNRANAALFDSVGDSVERVVLPTDRRRTLVRIWQDQAVVPRLVRRNTDVLFTPSSVGSIAAAVPEVVAVQMALALPSLRRLSGAELSVPHRAYYGPMMRLSHRRAAAVTPVSRYLGQQLVAETGLQGRKVEPILLGIDPVAEGPRRNGEYMLAVGTLWPYKNLEVAIDALAIARPDLPQGFRLLVAGRDPDGRQLPALSSRVATRGLAGQVEFLGHVEGALGDLYRNATVVVLLSRVEAFGIPALEAMAHGVPVIVADRAALPEVVGDGGLLADPDDCRDVAAKLTAVANDSELAERLATAGRRRAADLSWDRAADAYLDLFGRVAAGARV